jgi:hypothetical protein
MTTTELVNQAWLKAEGELPTFAAGADEWNQVLGYANFYIPAWAREEGVDWISLYDPAVSLGTISETDSFSFDAATVRKFDQDLGDKVRITWTDGVHYTDYDLVKGTELQQYPTHRVCARIGATLRFSRAFTTTDAEYGGALTAPVFGFPGLLAGESDAVPVDDPNWLVCVCAYQIALHDILRKDTANGHLSEANGIMARMISDNEGALTTMGTPWTPGDAY